MALQRCLQLLRLLLQQLTGSSDARLELLLGIAEVLNFATICRVLASTATRMAVAFDKRVNYSGLNLSSHLLT